MRIDRGWFGPHTPLTLVSPSSSAFLADKRLVQHNNLSCATTCQGCTNSIPEQVMSPESVVRTSQGHQEDVSGDSQLATAAKAACCIIIGETARTLGALRTENKVRNQRSQNVA